MKIIVAPNAFKNALTADEAAKAIIAGLIKSKLKSEPVAFPIGDGGDGTCVLLHKNLKGREVEITTKDPLNRTIEASFSLIEDGNTAVIEMADASGIRLLEKNELSPMQTSSYGTGIMVKEALNRNVKKIILGMGGSATVDGGCGLLSALGLQFLDSDGEKLDPFPKELRRMVKIDSSHLDRRLMDTEIIILCDVDNVLIGKKGAAQIFGPQKGASEREVRELDSFLEKFSLLAKVKTGKEMAKMPSAGTAGGAAGGLYAFSNAKLVSGIDYFLKMTGFEKKMKEADLLITGEGEIDDQTLSGKGPMGVARIAKKYNKEVIGLAGRIPLHPSTELMSFFDALFPVNHALLPLKEALGHTGANLERTAMMIGNLLSAR